MTSPKEDEESKSLEKSIPLKQEEMAPLAAPEIASMDSLGDKLQDSPQREPNKCCLPLSKDEVMKFAKDPYWIRLRWILFALFWITWVAILVISIIIIVVTPKCPTPKPKEWWQRAPIYQIYVKSFKDSDGDGIGDLKGITTKIQYLKDLGVESINLSPIFESPFENDGNDVENFESINSIYGSMQDFKDMVTGLQDHGLKLILDFTPNHSSDKHPWFTKSIQKQGHYSDYYVWKNGDAPPNNWLMINGDPAWSYNEERGEWYFHQIGTTQPDFNLRNPRVVKEIKDILRFWLDLGVDGFRFKYVDYLFESVSLEDEPEITSELDYSSLNHTKTHILEDNLQFLLDIRKLLDEKTEEDESKPRIMMTDIESKNAIKYYGMNGSIAHIPLNYISLDNPLNATNIYNTINKYLKEVKGVPTAWPNFIFDNHKHSRSGTWFGSEFINSLNMIFMLLPATPITYYGEELGMLDIETIGSSNIVGKSPMIWSKEEGAGFTYNSSVTPWMRIMDGYEDLNVECQVKDPDSYYSFYKALAKLRLSDAILQGEFNSKVIDGEVFTYSVVKKGNPGILVIVNFGEAESDSDISKFKFMPDSGSVLLGTNTSSTDHVGVTKVNFDSIKLRPKEGMVISFVANFE
uniref:alpha-glucosidase n=1 Tax=Lepeophtheirus salmonis TaxID=72036 RepID=A0A0K2TSQ6_LEPSM